MAHILGAIVINMAVSNNRGGPPKWMVKIMENPINPRMTLGGENPHYFRFNIHMDQPKNCLRRLSWEEEELDIELLNDAGIQAAKARPGWCWRELQNVVFFFVQVTYILPLVFGMLWGIVVVTKRRNHWGIFCDSPVLFPGSGVLYSFLLEFG